MFPLVATGRISRILAIGKHNILMFLQIFVCETISYSYASSSRRRAATFNNDVMKLASDDRSRKRTADQIQLAGRTYIDIESGRPTWTFADSGAAHSACFAETPTRKTERCSSS